MRLKAREAGVDLKFVHGSGPAGRITHQDLDAHIARPPEPSKPSGRAPNEAVETIKVVGMRRRIAENMAELARRIAHFSYVEEVDVTALEELRAALNARATEERPKLTLLPFLILGIVKAVVEFPQINAHYDDENDVITRFGAVHVGVATQTPNGLMVPVVRHAETLGLHECAREMRRVSEAARQGVAARDELSGSTITLTSLGALGGIVSTPIINRPEVAIVGVNKIVVRPVWRDGAFVPRKVMNLSSSFDHRVVDGYDAATFIQRLRDADRGPGHAVHRGVNGEKCHTRESGYPAAPGRLLRSLRRRRLDPRFRGGDNTRTSRGGRDEMNELRCKVLVIGGGPGGYVAAIRAGQLGLDTILVEADRLGGTCLNVGCIPSKALIHAAGAAHGLREPRALNAIGLSIGPPKLDFARTIAWKDSIVTRLTTGVGGLLKKAKVRTLLGDGDDRRRQDGDRQRRYRRDAASSPSILSLRPARSRWNCRRSSSAATSCLRPMRWR